MNTPKVGRTRKAKAIKTAEPREVTTNDEQRLYVIPQHGGGYSCLGYDVCLDRSQRMAKYFGIVLIFSEPGTLDAYRQYQDLIEKCRVSFNQTGRKYEGELTAQLIGLEHKRVEVVDCYGERRRFIVGKSTGWIPIHLEILRKDSFGGCGVTGTPFKSVRVIEVRA